MISFLDKFKNNSLRFQAYLMFGLVLGIVIFINILGQYFFTSFDLTEEKRFTLSKPTKTLLHELDDNVYVKVLLEGDFPAGFKRLQASTKEMLDDFRGQSSYINYEFEDPALGTTEQRNNRMKDLKQQGLVPMELIEKSSKETSRKIVFPFALVTYKGRTLPVSLIENQVPGQNQEIVLNNSISLLEYKLANVIQKLKTNIKPSILYVEGHGELTPVQTSDWDRTMAQNYNVGRVNLDSVIELKKDLNILIIAKPKSKYTEQQKFKIDQYAMNGGKIIWLIDRLTADMDSMSMRGNQSPVDYPLNLEDQLFKYGTRINPNLVLDLNCAEIPLRTGMDGQTSQLQKFKWYYQPLAIPQSKHPVVKGLDPVNFTFPSSIDTIRTKTSVKKTIILSSSDHSRDQYIPVNVNFEILRYPPDATKFNKRYLPLAVMLEGTFPSLYENRLTTEMSEGLTKLGLTFQEKSIPTKMLVVSDGDIAVNTMDPATGQPRPLGYNRYMNQMFANKDFLMNTIEYLLDNNGIIEARTRDVKLRLLNAERVKDEAGFWQILNIVLPLLFLATFGFIFNYRRKKKYAK